MVTLWSLHSRMSTRRLKCIKVYSEKGRLCLRSPCDVCWNEEITDPNVTDKHSICNVRYAHLRALMIMLIWAIPSSVDGDNLQANNASANCTSESVSKSSLRSPQTWRNWKSMSNIWQGLKLQMCQAACPHMLEGSDSHASAAATWKAASIWKTTIATVFATTSELPACLVLTTESRPLGLRCVGNLVCK